MKRVLFWMLEAYRAHPLWFWVPVVLTYVAAIALVNWAAHACRVAG